MTKVAATAVILAGGQSRRMGRDKALLLHRGKPLIQRVAESLAPVFDEVLLSVNSTDRYKKLAIPVVPDRIPDEGPLVALASVCDVARHDSIALVACDIANVDTTLLLELMELGRDADGALPVCDGRIQPLFAVYNRSRIMSMLTALIDDGERAVFKLIAAGDFRTMNVSADQIQNINTRADYEALARKR